MSGPVLTDAQGCTVHGLGDAVTVCARRDRSQAYRLAALSERYTRQDGLPRAATTLGPVQVSADATSAQIGPGAVSQRAMVTFRLPF